MRTIPPGDALGVFADRKVDWKNHPGFDMGFAAKNGESGLGEWCSPFRIICIYIYICLLHFITCFKRLDPQISVFLSRGSPVFSPVDFG